LGDRRLVKREFSETIIVLLSISMLILATDIQSTIRAAQATGTESPNLLTLQFSFPAPAINHGVQWDSVTMSGMPQFGAPGEPVLPFKLVKVLVPQGKDVQRIDVLPGRRRMLEARLNVAYGKTAVPISSNITVADQPDEKIYGSMNPFPVRLFSQVSEQFIRGYKLLLLKLHPVQYVPRTGEMFYFENMTLQVILKEDDRTSSLYRNLPEDKELVLGTVDNPDEADTYVKTASRARYSALANPLYSYKYVVITNNALRSAFQTLVDWKIQKGLSATIVLIEDILNNPNYHCDGLFGDGVGSPKFNDTQAHVRNFVKDAYLNWGTEYVLLGGDDEIIPARGVYDYAGNWVDYNIPCDMYYGALDGSWDKDNDTIFGEAVYSWSGPENGTAGEEADFFAEVYVGRATVDTSGEAANFVSKTKAYEQAAQVSYLKKALMVGERLDDITEAGNGKDLSSDIIPQYSTTRLYTRDETFSRDAVLNTLNSGIHIVNHDGHANYRSVMGLSRSDVDNLLLNTEYFMAYSLGCYSAAFDNATSGSDEAIAEHFLFSSSGAFAYIGNSRYGWYCSASNDGPGDRYDRSFFSVLSSGTGNLGKALQLSKERERVLDRWTYFTLNLLGDPETEIVTGIKAPTAHFETRTDLLAPPHIGGIVMLRGTAKRGTAVDSTFKRFTVAFGQGTSPTSWMTTGINLTNNGDSEVTNGILATWNTTQLATGTYTIKLTVFDADDVIGEDRQIVYVSLNARPVYIRANGSVDPSTAPIQRSGNVYSLTDNITSDGDGVVIEKNDVILDGAGYTVQGSGEDGAGICLLGRSNVMIRNVTVKAHLYGIFLKEASCNSILECEITNNTHGLFLLESSNNSILGNNLTSNYCGISLLSSSNNNSLVGNRITGSYGIMTGGMYLYMSSDNFIHHNVFEDNLVHVYDAAWDCPDPGLISPSVNVWDDGYPSGGNYWSGFSGTDEYAGPYQNVTGSDGIYDDPYIIDVHNRDRYPLVNPCTCIRNVAVASVRAVKTVVGRGWSVEILVTILSYNVSGGTINVSVYANSTIIEQTEVTLAGGSNFTTITLSWDTAAFAYGNYTLKAVAESLPGETDTTDNTLTDGVVTVSIPGDVTGDFKVNLDDITSILDAFGSTRSTDWLYRHKRPCILCPHSPDLDIDWDAKIDLNDITTALDNFGKTYP
jgi:parallel beta-helix repeat protein